MIALITPTGARPSQFALCAKFMKRQTYTGKVAWFIVDDFYPLTTEIVKDDFKENWTIFKIYPMPRWVRGMNTQARNISAGIQALVNNYSKTEIEAIFIIEDDDYYRPVYLERMMAHLGTHQLLGEKMTIYYNVAWRRYVRNGNTGHASLFQTAFTYDALGAMKIALPNKFIDTVLWTKVTNRHMFVDGDLAVGMKGMPGRGGIGAGHTRAMNMKDDHNLLYLKSLIGNEDAKLYERYYGNSSQSQHLLFAKKSL